MDESVNHHPEQTVNHQGLYASAIQGKGRTARIGCYRAFSTRFMSININSVNRFLTAVRGCAGDDQANIPWQIVGVHLNA